MTGPISDPAALAVAVQEGVTEALLREEIARWAADPGEPISAEEWPTLSSGFRAFLLSRADELLALPAVRALLDAQAALARLRPFIDRETAGVMVPRATIARAIRGDREP